MILPDCVRRILSVLEEGGFEAYVVGGCVRDSLLGLIPADYDITTSATPPEIEAIVTPYFTVHRTGIKHGTLTVMSEGVPYEVTTFRIDGEYSDNRRPDSVKYTRSLREDLARRDFTVNAMAFSEKTGVIDPFGGQDDLKNKLIRAVGTPGERFREDALRLMRALRFAAVYGFRIEEQTARAVDEFRGLIRNIAGERIAVELNKAVVGHFGKDKVTSLTLLFYSLGMNADSVRRFMRRLKYDNDTFHKTVRLVEYFESPLNPCRLSVKFMLNSFGEEMFFRLTDIRGAKEVADIAREIIEKNECYTLKQLAVKGSDLIEAGFKGRELSARLSALIDAVISGECENDRAKLMEYYVEC
jgi:tRNA nucleotidyltransferase (CCA-adding enzyme)